MSSGPRLTQDEATPAQIADHLRVCADDFVPPLAERVDIEAYADKIASRATRFEAWADGTLIGLVAIYANDPTGEGAFLTSVSTAPEHQGQGVASALLARAIELTRRQGFKRLALEVDSANIAAVRMYTRAGFAVGAGRGPMTRMNLDLRSPGNTESEP
jgi:ribosomal protein S18 acetylase RimI-like enzyme